MELFHILYLSMSPVSVQFRALSFYHATDPHFDPGHGQKALTLLPSGSIKLILSLFGN